MFSILDIVLVLLMFISGVLAMIRGFTREFLSIASWGAAFAVVLAILNLFPENSALLQPYIGHKVASQVIQGAIVFIIILIAVHLITIYISDKILNSSIGALDHTLGFIFGLARGLVAVVLLYLFFSFLVTDKVHNNWVSNARSLPLVKGTGEMIISLLPQDFADWVSKKVTKSTINSSELNSPTTKYRKAGNSDKNRGYQANVRRRLNQLVESTGSVQNESN